MGVYSAFSGMEDVFKALRRLSKKGGENHVVAIERLYHIAAKAAAVTFPNVSQDTITSDDLEHAYGQGGWDMIRQHVARLGRDRRSLAQSNFTVTTANTTVPKPQPGSKRCAAAAHSQQVALEECVLSLELTIDNEIVDLSPVTQSWACSLVHSTAAEAVDLEMPTVLVDECHGVAYLIILSLGRCLLGWPLRVQCPEKMTLALVYPLLKLTPLIVTQPYPGRMCMRTDISSKCCDTYLHCWWW